MFGKNKHNIPQKMFRGQPRTIFRRGWWGKNKGALRADVTIHELTPRGAKLADGAAHLLTWAGLGYTLYDTSQLAAPDWKIWLAAVGVPLAFYPLTRWSMRGTFKSSRRLRFTADEFRIFGRGRKGRFDRGLPHSFQLLPHDKRDEEKERLEVKALKSRRRGKIEAPARYYGKSFHLVFEYLGERFDIAEIYGERAAKRARDRLAAIDEVIDANGSGGGGTPLNPHDEWTAAPGNLPR